MATMKSSLRDALDTMRVAKSGKPLADLIRMAARLGSSIPQTAEVLDTECERVIAIVEGRDMLSISEADVIHAYLLALWWWHSFRMKYKQSDELFTLENVYNPLAKLWSRMPKGMRDDWETAHRTAWMKEKGR